MIKSLFLFSAFLLVYLLVLILGNVEIDFSGFFLWNILANKIWIFILLWIGIFLSWKNIIDSSDTERRKKILSSCFFTFLIILCSFITYQFLSLPNFWVSFDFINLPPIEQIDWLQSWIIILLIISFSFIFYGNNENITFENQKNIENVFENQKEVEFIQNYPKLNKIPGINFICKWWYKQWKYYTLSLIWILVLWFILRIWSLWSLWLVSDEFTINNAIEWFLNTGIPSLRSWLLYFDTPLHIILTWYLFEIFGNTEFIQRIPSVIFWTWLGLFIYLISKEVWFWKKIGLILTFLILIDPWFLEYSRFWKWYIMWAFFYLWAIYFFLKSLQANKYMYLWVLFTILWILTHKINYVLIFAPIVIFFISLKDKNNLRTQIHSIVSFIIIFIWYYLFWKLNSYWFWANGTFLSDFLAPSAEKNITLDLFDKIKKLIPFDFWKSFDFELVYYYAYSLPLINSLILVWLWGLFLNIKNIKKVLNKEIVFIIWILWFFSFTYLYSIQLFDKVNKWYIFFAMTLIIIFIWFALYILQQYNKKVIYYLTGFLSIFLLIQSFQIINSWYGDKIYGPYSIFEGFVFRQDNKTPCEYLSQSYQNGDIFITLGTPCYCKYYGDIDSNYYVSLSWYSKGVVKEDGNFYDLYEDSKIISNYDDFVDTITKYNEMWKKVYVYSSYSMLTWNSELAPRVWHIWWWFQWFLEINKNKKIYTGKDNITSIYLFE